MHENGKFDYVATLTDSYHPSNTLHASKINIEEKIDFILKRARSNDLFVFFFSGHGVSDPKTKKGYLLATDTRFRSKFRTALDVEWILDRIKRKNIQKSLLILDACRQQVQEAKGVGSNTDPLLDVSYDRAQISAIFYSTGEGKFSYEDKENGVFTKYLIEALEGKGDRDRDGVVSFSELRSYVEIRVRDWSLKNNKEQKPFVKTNGETFGDIALSLSKKTKIYEPPKVSKYSTKLKAQFLLRSSYLPGLGQYVKKHSWRSGIMGVGTVLLASYTYSNYNSYKSYKNSYNNSQPILLFAPNGLATIALWSQSRQVLNSANSASNATYAASLSLLGFYALNLIDAWFAEDDIFGGKSSFNAFPVRVNALFANTELFGGKASRTGFGFSFTFKF